MEIPSAFNSGLQGLQSARATAEQAAVDIVTSTSINPEQESSEVNTEVSAEVTAAPTSSEVPDLNQSIVNLKVAEYQAKASVEVIKSADDSLGTLLDVTA